MYSSGGSCWCEAPDFSAASAGVSFQGSHHRTRDACRQTLAARRVTEALPQKMGILCTACVPRRMLSPSAPPLRGQGVRRGISRAAGDAAGRPRDGSTAPHVFLTPFRMTHRAAWNDTHLCYTFPRGEGTCSKTLPLGLTSCSPLLRTASRSQERGRG
jgi:hypothetical protein